MVAHVGAAPSIDGLVDVADDEEIPVLGGEQASHLVLLPVGVLELVDEDVPPVARVLEPRALATLEEGDGEEEHVVKVEGVLGAHRRLVLAEL